MSFLTGIAHIFTSPKLAEGASLAGTVFSTLNPGLGSLVEMIAGAVYNVETRKPRGTPGPEKKAEVQEVIDLAAPVVLPLLSGVIGKAVADPTALAPALNAIIDDVVALFHVLGVFPPKTTAAAG